jgi:GNAT superfamily N-acetyltransferase
VTTETVAPAWMHEQVTAAEYEARTEDQCAGVEIDVRLQDVPLNHRAFYWRIERCGRRVTRGWRDPAAGLTSSLMESTTALIVRVTPGVHWHALEDDVVVGRGHALHRADGRAFISIDTWADDVFVALAEAMTQDLPSPVYTVVAEDDREHLGRWSMLGFRDNRREDEYAIPTAPEATGLASAQLPAGITLQRADEVDENRLRALDQAVRQDVPGYAGWVNQPEEFHRLTFENRWFDPTTYLIAVHEGDYVGFARILGLRRQPRLGLVGVLPAYRRRGLARALLAAALRPLPERGITTVSAEADEANPASRGLLRGIGAVRTGGAIELVRHAEAPTGAWG